MSEFANDRILLIRHRVEEFISNAVKVSPGGRIFGPLLECEHCFSNAPVGDVAHEKTCPAGLLADLVGAVDRLTRERDELSSRVALWQGFPQNSEAEQLLAELAALRRERDQLKEALEARHASKAVGDPDYCQGCGGRYRFDTTISSERWNAVIRENGLPEYLCSACILREFAKRGLGFTATLWGAEFNGETIHISVSPPERRES